MERGWRFTLRQASQAGDKKRIQRADHTGMSPAVRCRRSESSTVVDSESAESESDSTEPESSRSAALARGTPELATETEGLRLRAGQDEQAGQ